MRAGEAPEILLRARHQEEEAPSLLQQRHIANQISRGIFKTIWTIDSRKQGCPMTVLIPGSLRNMDQF